MKEAMRLIEEKFYVNPLSYGPQEDPTKRTQRIIEWSVAEFLVPQLQEMQALEEESRQKASEIILGNLNHSTELGEHVGNEVQPNIRELYRWRMESEGQQNRKLIEGIPVRV